MPTRSTLAQVFAARLAEIRRWRGLSQRVLGERLGLTKKQGSSRVNRYERGSSFGTAASLEALAEQLDVPAAALLCPTPEMATALVLFAQQDRKTQRKLILALTALASRPRALEAAVREAKGLDLDVIDFDAIEPVEPT